MFCYTGLTTEQVEKVTEEFSIYMTKVNTCTTCITCTSCTSCTRMGVFQWPE